jgi:hypothetical protein
VGKTDFGSLTSIFVDHFAGMADLKVSEAIGHLEAGSRFCADVNTGKSLVIVIDDTPANTTTASFGSLFGDDNGATAFDNAVTFGFAGTTGQHKSQD